MLSIQLLGHFCLSTGDGQVVETASPRLQSLLAYLLLHRSAPQPRQQVAAALWPETSEAQARTNLRNILHRLKQLLPELDAYVLDERGLLRWREDAPLALDVAAFEAAAAQAWTAGDNATSGSADAELHALEEAAQVYRGDLLPGCYDDWILPFREELHQTYLSVLERLASRLESQYKYRQSIQVAQRSLRHDPLNEAIYRQLIRLHGQCGDRAGGLRVYHTCAAVLEQELGVEPGVETQAAYRQLLKNEYAPVEAADPPAPLEAPQPNHNLPYPLTSLIGRAEEIQAVVERLPLNRLFTLTGAPGAGKTRLGLEAAARLAAQAGLFPGGVWWVDLSAVSAAAVIGAVAAVLGVREKPGEALLETLIQGVGHRRLLLVLDNAEHIIEGVGAFAAAVLSACPHAQILVTSREALGVVGETTWAVPPLSFPPLGPGPAHEPEAITRYEAVRLFVERAAAVLPTFQLTQRSAAAAAQICARLEGLPLAIELAAARVTLMTPEQIAARMDEALRFLTPRRGSSAASGARYRTLEAAVAWSYQLLGDSEKMLLRRLAVFSGGFTLEAAEQVAGRAEPGPNPGEADLPPGEVLDLLSRLIDKSLVKVMEGEQAGEARYRLLEMIRQYAQARLGEAGEDAAVQQRHACYYVSLVEAADPHLRGPEQGLRLNRLEREHDNLRQALRWAQSAQDEETALRLVASLWQFWDIRGYFKEGRQWLRAALALGSGQTPLRAKALKGAGALAWSQSDYAEARARMAESLAIYRELGEKRDLAVGLFNLALVTYSPGDYAAAVPLLEECLAIFKELNHQQGIANALNSLGVIAAAQGDYKAARPRYEESLAIRKELGDQRGLAIGFGNLGMTALKQGDVRDAEHYMNESLRLYQAIGDKRGEATVFNELGHLERLKGSPAAACARYQQAVAAWLELDSQEGLAAALEGTAAVCGQRGKTEAAVKLLAAASVLRIASGALRLPADQPEHERLVEELRGQLGERVFASAWSQGQVMLLEQALELSRQVCSA